MVIGFHRYSSHNSKYLPHSGKSERRGETNSSDETMVQAGDTFFAWAHK
jgi:hypothetical protein